MGGDGDPVYRPTRNGKNDGFHDELGKTTWGISSGSVSSSGKTLCYKIRINEPNGSRK